MVAALVLTAFVVWLVIGIVLSARAGVREASGESRALGAVVGAVRALPPEWIAVGLAVLVGTLWV
ncbi:hypothetical protein [Rubrivirga marina]|uniref:Uncharacterized protein n=1 Tax=Rubrivirga marina TaxID=1196024 RepID=A0A271J416_9BACT|nr:hypothetical protein [Rubrivirga marina]PAP78100.1 hypothetical protein BSZ37_17480 [Rubrivirga marina]